MTTGETKRKLIEAFANGKKYGKHYHNIFVGANATGKSNMLASIVKGLSDKHIPVYYICSWNRKIVNKRTELKKTFEHLSVEDVLETRLNEKFYNQDIFMNELGIELVMNELFMEYKKYTELFRRFLKIEVTAVERTGDIVENGEDLLEVNGEVFEKLSDSQISMMRMIMEVNYAYEQNCRYVVIDEVDINLDHTNSSGFLEYLKEEYPEIYFIVSAHSLYTILHLNDFNVIKITEKYSPRRESLCEIYDSNDLDHVEIIDKKLFSGLYEPNKLDEKLGNCLRLVLSGMDVDKKELQQLKEQESLSTRQQIVMKYLSDRLEGL